MGNSHTNGKPLSARSVPQVRPAALAEPVVAVLLQVHVDTCKPERLHTGANKHTQSIIALLSSSIKPPRSSLDHGSNDHEPDQMELVQLQQRRRNTAIVFTVHPKLHEFPWSFPLSMSVHRASHSLVITCTLSRRYNANRFITSNESYVLH